METVQPKRVPGSGINIPKKGKAENKNKLSPADITNMLKKGAKQNLNT